jgi:hypothetical protein
VDVNLSRPLSLLLVLACLVPGCRREARAPSANLHPSKGRVVEVDLATQRTLAHEDIPGSRPR